jgi:hypothetical protein
MLSEDDKAAVALGSAKVAETFAIMEDDAVLPALTTEMRDAMLAFAGTHATAPAESAWIWGHARGLTATAWADLDWRQRAWWDAEVALFHAHVAAIARHRPPPPPPPPEMPARVNIDDTVLAQNAGPFDMIQGMAPAAAKKRGK